MSRCSASTGSWLRQETESVSTAVKSTEAEDRTAAVDATGLAGAKWGLLGVDGVGMAAALRSALEVGRLVSASEVDGDRTEDRFPVYPSLKNFVEALEDETPELMLVDLTGIGSPKTDVVDSVDGDGLLPAVARAETLKVLGLIQAWLADERFSRSRMVLVTRYAQAVDGVEDLSGLVASPVWGLVRSAQSENPGRFALLDVDDEQTSWGALLATLTLDEPQLAIRRGTAYAPRLTRRAEFDELVPPTGVSQWRLSYGKGGGPEELHLVECPEVGDALAPGQVRVGMRIAALNFRDVLVSTGVISSVGWPAHNRRGGCWCGLGCRSWCRRPTAWRSRSGNVCRGIWFGSGNRSATGCTDPGKLVVLGCRGIPSRIPYRLLCAG